MRKKIISLALGALLAVVNFPAHAQQAKKIPRIGLLVGGSASSDAARIEAFQQGLRQLGYVEGKNIAVEYRYAEGKPDRLNELAATLVRLPVDVIVTAGPTATRAAKKATQTIPIVMAQVNDPIAAGFVANLARPGGNITGLSVMAPELSGKQIELLKEIIPKLSRVAVFTELRRSPGTSQALKETEFAAGGFGVQVQYLDIGGPKDIETAFQEARRGRASALLVLSGPILFVERKVITELAVKNRLPAVFPWPESVEEGGLMTYGPSITGLFRRAATYVDKILKGTKPADLPVEQPTKFELVINLKTAKQIGLTIPPNVLARADRVIK
jgi:putative tryptophan/tyrosine transport system substrate-binding protein